MAKKKFSVVGHFPIFEFINARGPISFCKVGDRQFNLVNIRRVEGKYFQTKMGVFEMDGEYEGKLFGQSFYIHNISNAKPYALEHIEVLQKLYREEKMEELSEELLQIKEVADKASSKQYGIDCTKAYHNLVAYHTKNKSTTKLSYANMKWLIDFISFDKTDLMLFNIKKMKEKKPNATVSGNLSTIMPLLIISVIGIVIPVTLKFLNPLKIIPELMSAHFIGGLGLF